MLAETAHTRQPVRSRMNIKGEEGDHLYRAAQLQVQLDQSADRSPLQQVEEETLARPTTGVDTGEGRPGQ